MNKENALKTNLQFFAEPAEETPEVNEPETTDEPELSVDEQLQQMRVELAKYKKATDKASSEAADWKKKYKATQSEQEQQAMEKAEKEAEREAQFNELLKENSVNKLEKNFLTLGYPEDKAHDAAIAQFEGDTDSLFKIQSEIQQALIKAREAEWIKSRPEVTTGAGDGTTEDPFVKGFNS